MTRVLNIAVVVAAYVLAHGLTALLITPLQSRLIPEITPFASLLYLPHGVRVLSTWLVGGLAFVPLCLGAFLSELLFTPGGLGRAADPVLLLSIAVGATSAPLAFRALTLAGPEALSRRQARLHWTWLLLAGTLASVLNSVGQSLVFSGEVLTDHSLAVLAVYAIGDLFGLVVTTLALMFVFRWLRFHAARR